ncbi:unnamed protein product [Rodentolepis nana]|uniref:BRCT domain-containing protein n=1 Tax=Rodentolepis nana TaxID=102285 RepID=A0A158QH41_RODNA|nr:unnamed protein product [Rodentolepis nana]
MSRKCIFDGICEDSTVEESTLEEVRDSAGSSHRAESIFTRPSAEIETSVELDATNRELPENSGNQHTKRKNRKSRKNTGRLRCRRNLVNSFDITNNETLELSVAPAIDVNDDQDVNSAVKADSQTKAKKIVPRHRRQLVNTSEQSTAANTTFELSLASFVGNKSVVSESLDAGVNEVGKRRVLRSGRKLEEPTEGVNQSQFEFSVGQKPNEAPPNAAKKGEKIKPKAHRARKALVVSNMDENEETFDLSVASAIMKSKSSDESVSVAPDPNIKKRPLRSRRALVESFGSGNNVTFELSVANPIEKKPTIANSLRANIAFISNLDSQEHAEESTALENRPFIQETRTSKVGDLESSAHLRRSTISISDTIQAAESVEQSSIHPTKPPRRKVTLRGRRGYQKSIGDSVMHVDFAGAAAKSQQRRQPLSSGGRSSKNTRRGEISTDPKDTSNDDAQDRTSVLHNTVSEIQNQEDTLEAFEKSHNEDSTHDISKSIPSASSAARLNVPSATHSIQMEDQSSKDDVTIPLSIMESAVSLEETLIQSPKVPNRKIILRGRRGTQNVGDSVIQVDFAGVSAKTSQPRQSSSIPVQPVTVNEQVALSTNAADGTVPLNDDSMSTTMNNFKDAPGISQDIDPLKSCVVETDDQVREDDTTIPFSLMEKTISLEETVTKISEAPKRKIRLRGRRAGTSVGDSLIRVDFTGASAQANQLQGTDGAIATKVERVEISAEALDAVTPVQVDTESCHDQEMEEVSMTANKSETAVLIGQSSARRTTRSVSSTSVRTSTDVISATKTEVTHVGSANLAMDNASIMEAVSMNLTKPDESVSMLQSTMSPSQTRESVSSKASKGKVEVCGRRATNAVSSSMMEIDFAEESKPSYSTGGVPLEKDETMNMSSGQFEVIQDTEGSSASRVNRTDSSVQNASVSMAVSNTLVRSNERADEGHLEEVKIVEEDQPVESTDKVLNISQPAPQVNLCTNVLYFPYLAAQSVSLYCDASTAEPANPSAEPEIANALIFRFLESLIVTSHQQPAKSRALRSRRTLVDLRNATANETTFEISVASAAGQKSSIDDRGTVKTSMPGRESLPQEATIDKSIISATSNDLQNSHISRELTLQTEYNEIVEVIVDSTQDLQSHSRLPVPMGKSGEDSPVAMEIEDSLSVTRQSRTKSRKRASRSPTTPMSSNSNAVEEPASSLRKRARSKRMSNSLSGGASGDFLVPLSVSPRRVWPSPLRRSGSIGYTCPSISCVHLGETKSKNSCSKSCQPHSQISRRTTARTGDTTSSTTSCGTQRKMITQEEIREMEMRLMDISANDVSVDQELIPTKTGSVNPAPSIHVPEDLTLCEENVNVTVLQDMLMGPQVSEERSPCKTPTSKSTGRSKSRRSVQFAPLAEVFEEHSEDKWRRVSLGINDASPSLPHSPHPSSNERNCPPMALDDLSPIPFRSSGLNLNDTFIDKSLEMVGSPEFPQKTRLELTQLEVNEPAKSRGAHPSLTPLALETIMSWKDGSLWLSTDPDDLVAATEKTFGENLVTGGQTLTPEQFRATLTLLVGNGSEFDVNRTSCERTCAIDPSMVNQSQWLPPPEEGMEYDMDALSKALHYMLLGWTEPSDPIFIPLPKVAYQRRCTEETGKGVRRGTRIRVHTPIDSWDRVYREVRVNPVTGRKEELPLGYLRYPKPEEFRRRQKLLKARRCGSSDSPSKLLAKKRAREARLKKLAAKRRREEGKSMCIVSRCSSD